MVQLPAVLKFCVACSSATACMYCMWCKKLISRECLSCHAKRHIEEKGIELSNESRESRIIAQRGVEKLKKVITDNSLNCEVFATSASTFVIRVNDTAKIIEISSVIEFVTKYTRTSIAVSRECAYLTFRLC